MSRREATNSPKRTKMLFARGHQNCLKLIIVISMLVTPAQCFTHSYHRGCLTRGIRTTVTMQFSPKWFPNSIWPTIKQKVSVDVYSDEKKSLLRAIAATRIRKTSSSLESLGEGTMTDRQSILSCVSILETIYANRQSLSSGTAEVAVDPNRCADGLWSLIYSTKQPSQKNPSLFASSSSTLLSTWIDNISGELYKVFFRFAPLLAGGQDESNNQGPTRATSTTQSSVSSSSVSNKQLIDLVNRKVVNVVTFENAFLTKLLGPRETSDKDSSGAGTGGGKAKIEIKVTFIPTISPLIFCNPLITLQPFVTLQPLVTSYT